MIPLPAALSLTLFPVQDPLLQELRSMAPGPIEGVSVPVVGDVDGDGDPDLIVSGFGDSRVLFNRDFGVLTPGPIGLFAGPCNCRRRSVTLAELDGNDLPDVLVDGTPYFADGGGGFVAGDSPIPPLSFGARLKHGLEDVDEDGDTDVFFFVLDGDELEILTVENLGGRNFAQLESQTISTADMPEVEDLDGDGDLDFLFIGSTNVARFFQDASGRFVEDAAPIPFTGQGFQFGEGKLGDVDGDGDVDLVVLSLFDGAWIYSNDGSGNFTLVKLIEEPSTSPFLALLDLEADGDLDLLCFDVSTNPDAPPVPALLFENTGAFAFSEVSGRIPRASAAAWAAFVADFDSDGFDDVLFDNQGFEPYRLLLNDGGGHLVDANRHVPRELGLPTAMEIADLDGDGSTDVVADLGGHPMLWLNDGAGAMREESGHLPTGLRTAYDLAVGDVDGDGDLDVFWPQIGQSRLLVNDGSANFVDETASRLPVDDWVTLAAALADLDGDGDLDAILGNDRKLGSATTLVPNNEVWFNDGDGFFSAGGFLPAAGQTRALAVADVDGDGDLDVIAGNLGQNLLFRNRGDGRFDDAMGALPVSLASTRDVELGDLDGDGSPDAFFVNLGEITSPGCYDCTLYNVSDEVVMNDGSGNFTARSTPFITGGVGFDVELADFDGDGDLDAVVAQAIAARINRPYPAVELLWNDGTGELTRSSRPLASQRFLGLGLGVGDLDGDEDPDVVANLRIFTNRTRSLAWRSLPRVGVPLVLDLCGPGSSPYVLAGALEAIARPTDFGLLRIAPHTIRFLEHGLLGEQGCATRRFEVPNDPELTGRRLFWQAIVGTPPRFTNLEPTRFF